MAARAVFAGILLIFSAGCSNQSSNNADDQKKTPMENVSSGSKQVKVYLNPLVMLLAGAEKQKGRPLTRDEVLQVRDTAVSVMMSPEQAKKFYESLDAQVPVHRMNPDRVWEEWQEIRNQVK